MKKKSNTLKYLIGAVLLFVVIAIIGKSAGWFGGAAEVNVSVESVSTRTIVQTVSASGKIQPETEVKISPDVSGEITELYVKEGQKVKKGDLLLRIRPDIYESSFSRSTAALNQIKANLANAEARLSQVQAQFRNTETSFARTKKLYEDKVISASEFEQALAGYEAAKADVEAARQNVNAARFNVASAQATVRESQDNLSRTTIFAPVDGTVSKLNVERGERVVGTSQMAGTELMRISNLTSMEVRVDVNENDINRVKLGDTSIIQVDAFLDKKFKGIVTEIASSANITGLSADQVTNFSVRIRILPESYQHLITSTSASPFRPGLSATVDIQTEIAKNALAIPIQAVTTRLETDTVVAATNLSAKPLEVVFVVENGKAVRKQVTTGIQDDMYIEIKGLADGVQVITAPYIAISKTLKEGTNVKVVDKSKLFERPGNK